MAASGYVLAGFETIACVLDNFIENRRGKWNNNFTREQISNFLSSTTSGFLHSFGQDFSGKKKFNKYKQKETDIYKFCRDIRLFDNCTFIADSGGFQISVGKMTKTESELLFKLYYEWIEEGKPYREFLIPAEIVNRYGPPKIFETDQEDGD